MCPPKTRLRLAPDPGLGSGVWGLGFGVWGLGFGVWGLGFGVWGLEFRVQGSGFRISGSARGDPGVQEYLTYKKAHPPRTLL